MIKIKNNIVIILIGLLIVMLVPGGLATGEDETTLEASVQVMPIETMSYGIRVSDFRGVIWPDRALGTPDSRDAILIQNSWISLELEESVLQADKISMWIASTGWFASYVKIYVSTDGRKWKNAVNTRVKSASPQRLDFTGSFGNVAYIKVIRSGLLWSWVYLDTISVKGGDR